MIEAVNSVVSNAQSLRGVAEQQSSVASSGLSQATSGDPNITAPQAPFISPYIVVDDRFDRAVLQVRDSDTGDVVRQFPTEGSLRAQQVAAEVAARAESDLQTGLSDVSVQSADFQGSQTLALSNDAGQAQQAAAALSTAAATQTTEITQATVNVTA